MAARKMSGLSKTVRELRIHLCQRSPSSQGVRDFVEQHYIGIKNANPDLPVLIRECSGIQPKLFARFDFGKESSVYLTDKSSSEVLQAVEQISKEQK
ncbi:NADH dehydrogenase [ubiquinone] 1 alpha subcomplex subunit 2-like [Rhopilema esculentum]|uniref:NADH dehydrogenase [ubiquinone] 1 alpha subcomplex subunit 2-like n=1 Tax=Rhopilema esculentum TaxID=499914 RepID=UPI0031DBF387|eukprot:gene406-10073_t